MIKIKDKTGKKIPIDLKEMPGSCWVQNSVETDGLDSFSLGQ